MVIVNDYSPVNLWFNIKQIAKEMILAFSLYIQYIYLDTFGNNIPKVPGNQRSGKFKKSSFSYNLPMKGNSLKKVKFQIHV